MHTILTTSDDVLRRVTIHYGLGLSVSPGQQQERYDWSLVQRHLNGAHESSSIIIDYYENTKGKNHPLIHGKLFDELDVEPDDSDRLLKSIAHPQQNSAWFDNVVRPQKLHLLSNRFEMTVKRNEEQWSAAISTMLTIDLISGKLTFTT